MARIRNTLYEDLCTFMIMSRAILLVMRNISGEIGTENQNTYIFPIIFKIFLKESRGVY
jgi:hypothetical protein